MSNSINTSGGGPLQTLISEIIHHQSGQASPTSAGSNSLTSISTSTPSPSSSKPQPTFIPTTNTASSSTLLVTVHTQISPPHSATPSATLSSNGGSIILHISETSFGTSSAELTSSIHEPTKSGGNDSETSLPTPVQAQERGKSSPVITGIVGGVLGFLLLASIACFLYYRHRQRLRNLHHVIAMQFNESEATNVTELRAPVGTGFVVSGGTKRTSEPPRRKVRLSVGTMVTESAPPDYETAVASAS